MGSEWIVNSSPLLYILLPRHLHCPSFWYMRCCTDDANAGRRKGAKRWMLHADKAAQGVCLWIHIKRAGFVFRKAHGVCERWMKWIVLMIVPDFCTHPTTAPSSLRRLCRFSSSNTWLPPFAPVIITTATRGELCFFVLVYVINHVNGC